MNQRPSESSAAVVLIVLGILVVGLIGLLSLGAAFLFFTESRPAAPPMQVDISADYPVEETQPELEAEQSWIEDNED